ERDMLLAGMIEARAHQSAGLGILCHYGAARLQGVVDVVEDLGDSWAARKERPATVDLIPDIDGEIDQLGHLGTVFRLHWPQVHVLHGRLSAVQHRSKSPVGSRSIVCAARRASKRLLRQRSLIQKRNPAPIAEQQSSAYITCTAQPPRSGWSKGISISFPGEPV